MRKAVFPAAVGLAGIIGLLVLLATERVTPPTVTLSTSARSQDTSIPLDLHSVIRGPIPSSTPDDRETVQTEPGSVFVEVTDTTTDCGACTITGTVRSIGGAPIDGAVVILEDVSVYRPTLSESNEHDVSARDVLLNRVLNSDTSLPAFADALTVRGSGVVGLGSGAYPSDAGPGHRIRTQVAINGVYAFHRVSPATMLRVSAGHPRFGISAELPLVLQGDNITNTVDIILSDGTVVLGSVTDEQGQPVPQVAITFHGLVESLADHPCQGGTYRTDESGVFRSIPLPFDRIAVSAWAAGYYLYRSPYIPVTAINGMCQLDDIRLTRSRRLVGRLVERDGRVPNLSSTQRRIHVAASWQDPTSHGASLRSLDGDSRSLLNRDDGQYEILLRHSDLRFVSIWADDLLLGVARIQTVDAAPEVLINLGAIPPRENYGRLRVFANDVARGIAVREFQVSCVAASFAAPERFPMPTRAFAYEGTGFAEIEPLRPGTYDVSVWAPHFGMAMQRVTVVPDVFVTQVTIPLERAHATLRGHVRDTSGAPLGNVDVTIYGLPDSTARVMLLGRTRTTQLGEFAIAPVGLGRYALVALADGFAPTASSVIDVSTDDNSAGALVHVPPMTARKGLCVVIEARRDGGADADGFTIQIRDRIGVPVYEWTRPRAASSASDRAEFSLEPGTYLLSAMCVGSERIVREFHIAEDEMFTLDFKSAR